MRRTIAGAVGLAALASMALLPSVASAQYVPPPTLPPTTTTTSTTSTSVLPDEETSTTTEAPTTTAEETTTTAVEPDAVTRPTTEEVLGAVTRRPLPRTGNDIGGTALFGGALTVLGVALALGARRRRNSFDGA